MEKHWYLSRNGQVFGPVPDAHLRQSVTAGRVLPTDLLNEAGQPNWVTASSVPGLFPPAKVEALPVDAEIIEDVEVIEDVVVEVIEVLPAAKTARVTCFGCFREVSIEFMPGVPTVNCPKCRTAIETGETADAAPAHQAAFAKLESPAAFKERMQKKVAAAEAASARDGAIIGGLLGGLLPPS